MFFFIFFFWRIFFRGLIKKLCIFSLLRYVIIIFFLFCVVLIFVFKFDDTKNFLAFFHYLRNDFFSGLLKRLSICSNMIWMTVGQLRKCLTTEEMKLISGLLWDVVKFHKIQILQMILFSKIMAKAVANNILVSRVFFFFFFLICFVFYLLLSLYFFDVRFKAMTCDGPGARWPIGKVRQLCRYACRLWVMLFFP